MDKQLFILVVDDDSGHRNMLCTLLTGWGYRVQSAGDGEEAVSFCKQRPYELVLMDVRMPKKSGLEALLEIKACNPAIPVLIMTAFSDVEAAVAAIKAGAYDYLTKPLDFEKLKISLRNIFEFSSLKQENTTLAANLNSAFGTSGIIGQSAAMHNILNLVQTIAPSEATVLINGESGTGKELIAKAIHLNSPRRAGPYIAFNCAAITESLFESELFGHEKGAFTGADRRRDGRFMAADKGTLFLDEVGEIPLLMQAKLLRVLQEREVQPVGSDKTYGIDVRIITATNKNLAEEVEAGRFREDLYYRINVVSLDLPPLRQRPEDTPLLAQHFLNSFTRQNGKQVKGFTPGAMDALIHYAWPGNVRELENVIERAVVLLLGEYVSERELPPQVLRQSGQKVGVQEHSGEQVNWEAQAAYSLDSTPTNAPTNAPVKAVTLKDMEREVIMATLAEAGGNKSEAAKRLGITRKTLHLKLQKYEDEGEIED